MRRCRHVRCDEEDLILLDVAAVPARQHGARDRAAAIDREMPLADDRIARQALEIVAQIEAARDAAGQGFREFVAERRLIDPAPLALDQIGRESWRERVCKYVES